MTVEEKAAAFDLVVEAMTNRWSNGKFGWFCANAAGGAYFDTPEEVVPDFVGWCEREAKYQRLRKAKFATQAEGKP